MIVGFVICPRLMHCAHGRLSPQPEASFVSDRDSQLEMARRHVRVGTERVARQEELVAWLDQEGNYPSQTALAREILATLRTSLDLMRDHLRRIEGKSES